MTETIRTQCPNCHTQYKVGVAQLSAGKSKAKCSRCNTSFIIKDNLVSKSLIDKDSSTKASSAKASSTKANSAKANKAAAQSSAAAASNTSVKDTANKPASTHSSTPTPNKTTSKTSPNTTTERNTDIKNTVAKKTSSSSVNDLDFDLENAKEVDFDSLFDTPVNASKQNEVANKPSASTTIPKSSTVTIAPNLSGKAADTDPADAPFDFEIENALESDTGSISFDDSPATQSSNDKQSLKKSSSANAVPADTDTIIDDEFGEAWESDTDHTPEPTVATTDDMMFHDDMDDGGANEDTGNDADDDWDFDDDIIDESLINDQIKDGSDSGVQTDGSASNSADDGSWLEDLLADEDKQTSNTSAHSMTTPKSDVDLTTLLDDLGVESSAPLTPTAEQSSAMADKRVKSKKVRSRSGKSILAPLLWLIGCAALLLLLLAQYVVFNLDNLIKDPQHRASLQSFCDVVTCALPDADISNISITNQALKPSKIKSNATDISALIVNEGTSEQLYPNLKAQIYGLDGVLIGEFVATPDDYLITSHSVIGPSQDTLFMLTIDINADDIGQVEVTTFY